MKKIFFIFIAIFIYTLHINAKDIAPSYTLEASGGVTDLLLTNEKLYVATTASSVDIFDMKTKEKINSIKIPKISDFMKNIINAKVYSIDIINDNLLILSQGENGGRDLSIYKNNKIENIISANEKLYIAKAKFINENFIIYALLSNQIFIYDIKNKKVISELQVSQSKFSNFSLTSDKSKILVSDESGILNLFDTKNFDLIKKFDTLNLDNVFQVDIKNNLIITAGQDRRCVVYSMDGKLSYYKEANFLIYSVGLSPSGKIGAFASDEENNVTVFNTNTKENLHKLINNKTTLTNILFINENEIFVTSDDEKVNYYKLN